MRRIEIPSRATKGDLQALVLQHAMNNDENVPNGADANVNNTNNNGANNTSNNSANRGAGAPGSIAVNGTVRIKHYDFFLQKHYF